MKLDATRTVREFATEIPNATRIFEELGIDYCCGGAKSLRDACARARLPVEEVLLALEQGSGFRPQTEAAPPDFTAGSLSGLIEHIISKHHAYAKHELPRIQQLLNKVVLAHGGTEHPELGKIRRTFEAVSAELTSHMMKEEHVLFPYIAELEEAINTGRRVPKPVFGTLRNPVHVMELEHESAGAALSEIRTLSGGYTAPADACFSYKTLYTALKEFEADLHQHVHLENNVLFPRAIGLERVAVVR